MPPFTYCSTTADLYRASRSLKFSFLFSLTVVRVLKPLAAGMKLTHLSLLSFSHEKKTKISLVLDILVKNVKTRSLAFSTLGDVSVY